MILAAGFGTRMRPLTETAPKALLPVHGVPLLEWAVAFLQWSGVSRVVVNAHHHGDQVEAWAVSRGSRTNRAGSDAGSLSTTEGSSAPPRVIRESEILGTAGGIANASAEFGTDPVLFFNVDLIFRPDLAQVLQLHRQRVVERPEVFGTLLLIRNPRFAKVRVEGPWITEIRRDADPGDPALWAFSGVYLLTRPGIDALPAGGFADLAPILRGWAHEGRLAACLCPGVPFLEVGGLESYWETHRALALAAAAIRAGASRGAEGLAESDHRLLRDAPLWIDPDAQVDSSARCTESVVLVGARIARDAIVTRSVIGPEGLAEGTIDRRVLVGTRSAPLMVLSAEEEDAVRRVVGDPSASGQLLHGTPLSRRVVRVTSRDGTRIVVVEPRSAAVSTGGRIVYPRRFPPGEGPDDLETFVYVARHLESAGVRVPRLYAVDRAERMAVMEDVGDDSLETLVHRHGAGSPQVAALYEAAVAQIARMQGPTSRVFDPGRTNNPDYDASFVEEYEIGYFVREVARDLLGVFPAREAAAEANPDDAKRAAFLEEGARLAHHLQTLPRCLVHRDFQSRNLMGRGTREVHASASQIEVVVIDVQGARWGPYTYDPASLLWDPYVEIPETLRARLIETFVAGAEARFDLRTRDPQADLQVAALVRLLQASAAFAFLGAKQKRPGFLEFLDPSLARAQQMAESGGWTVIAQTLALCRARWLETRRREETTPDQ